MKVVFLDFDGVLNSYWYFRNAHRDGDLLPVSRWIDPKAVRWLNAIIEKTGAVVVVSSTWRLDHPVEGLQALLDAAGFNGQVIDKTPKIWEMERGHEIDQWLKEHPEVSSFVILDDNADMVHLSDRLVRTTAAKGLKPIHVEAAVLHLGAKP